MEKIKVIHMIEEMEVGGIEKFISQIVQNLDPNRFSSEVWCISSGGAVADELIERGLRVKILNIKGYRNPLNFKKLAGYLMEAKPDIIHTHTYFSATIGRVAAKMAGVPVLIAHVHNVYTHYSLKHCLVEKFLASFTDKIVCCSKAVKHFVVDREKISPAKTTVIYNSVDPAEFNSPVDRSALRRSVGAEEDDLLLITVASLTSKKGHRFFLEALEKIARDNCNVKYLVVGDGPARKGLEAQAKNLGLGDHVVFFGIGNNVPELLQAADVFVLPSIAEGFPLVLVEAFYAGLVVVATDVGGVSELVSDKVDGILVPEGKIYPLQQAVLSLLDDRGKLARLQENVIKKDMSRYFVSNMVRQVAGLYEEIIETKRTKIGTQVREKDNA